MTTNKLDTILHNIYADHTDGCDPDDCWSTEIIEAYIAERVVEELKQVPFSYIRIESGDEYFPTQSTEYLQKRLEELASENT